MEYVLLELRFPVDSDPPDVDLLPDQFPDAVQELM